MARIRGALLLLAGTLLGSPSAGDAKHVPVQQSGGCCGGGLPPTPTAPLVVPEPEPARCGVSPRKLGCRTTMGDPLMTYVVVTETTYSTLISTLRRIERETSFSTTTVTQTVRLTTTELSISARTRTQLRFFTLPTFQVLTRFYYDDQTVTRTLTGTTFFTTFIAFETIVVNSFSRVTSTSVSIETSTQTLELVVSQVSLPTSTFTFTDPLYITITNAPATVTTTVVGVFTRRTTITVYQPLTVVPTVINLVSLAVSSFTSTTWLRTVGTTFSTISISATQPSVVRDATSTYTTLIS